METLTNRSYATFLRCFTELSSSVAVDVPLRHRIRLGGAMGCESMSQIENG